MPYSHKRLSATGRAHSSSSSLLSRLFRGKTVAVVLPRPCFVTSLLKWSSTACSSHCGRPAQEDSFIRLSNNERAESREAGRKMTGRTVQLSHAGRCQHVGWPAISAFLIFAKLEHSWAAEVALHFPRDFQFHRRCHIFSSLLPLLHPSVFPSNPSRPIGTHTPGCSAHRAPCLPTRIPRPRPPLLHLQTPRHEPLPRLPRVRRPTEPQPLRVAGDRQLRPSPPIRVRGPLGRRGINGDRSGGCGTT